MPIADDAYARLGALERDYGGMAARVGALERDVGSILPMVSEFATLNERVKNFGDDLSEIKVALLKRDAGEALSRTEAKKDRRAAIRWAVSLTVTIIIALVTLFVAIISSGGHL